MIKRRLSAARRLMVFMVVLFFGCKIGKKNLTVIQNFVQVPNLTLQIAVIFNFEV